MSKEARLRGEAALEAWSAKVRESRKARGVERRNNRPKWSDDVRPSWGLYVVTEALPVDMVHDDLIEWLQSWKGITIRDGKCHPAPKMIRRVAAMNSGDRWLWFRKGRAIQMAVARGTIEVTEAGRVIALDLGYLLNDSDKGRNMGEIRMSFVDSWTQRLTEAALVAGIPVE